MQENNPVVSFVIPTLNAANVLEECLRSIAVQNYPKSQVEIVISDGGSSDNTLEIAKKYNAIVIPNPLKTGEAGKAAAVRKSTGEFIALIDSDNVLPGVDWLWSMIDPLLKHPEAVGSEPLRYEWRATDGFITRYCALIGMNDPLTYFTGNYDRFCLLSNKWTETPHEEADKGKYFTLTFDKRGVPTIGANGTVFRAEYLKSNLEGDYLFDIDILANTIQSDGCVSFIKVKNSIIHTFCESSIKKFSRKQQRRVKDFLFHKSKNNRTYEWFDSSKMTGILKFIIYCVLGFPILYQTILGFTRKKDTSWLFHPLACYITLWEYSTGYLTNFINKSEFNRAGWRQ